MEPIFASGDLIWTDIGLALILGTEMGCYKIWWLGLSHKVNISKTSIKEIDKLHTQHHPIFKKIELVQRIAL